jgi:putative heme-binding domain-containing protein
VSSIRQDRWINSATVHAVNGLLNAAAKPLLLVAVCFFMPAQVDAQEAQWIWSPEHPRGQAIQGDCYFRKTLQLSSVEEATITITADDKYELFVNGRLIGQGSSIRQMEKYDITRLLGRGRNVIAVRATNVAPGAAALVSRVLVKPVNGNWLSFSTDDSWRTALEVVPGWQSATYNDGNWKSAQAFGPLGETPPWDRREEVEQKQVSEHARFRVSPEFSVDEILGNEVTGSLICMAFNEFGHMVASQEGGPLLLIYDSDKDGAVDKTRVYCETVKNIQGILPLNGDVFVTGDGPEGSGIYRLVDKDRNGAMEDVRKVVGFKGTPGEHGAHSLILGPDGLIYCVLGNHVSLDKPYATTSTLKAFYEGDINLPRYEDPGGHANGIKAPGGVVFRMDIDGSKVEVVAGGLRNAYDIAFNAQGNLYVHDSDMESDIGSVWYSPTSLFQITEGAEFGWRSGWAKWPTYYFDRSPTLLETGRGSPTGATVYDHVMFPQRYHGSLFLADWSEGRILSIKLTDDGQATQQEVFLQGQPLNVTDLAIGPDGSLFFCTGGRGTKGGIYRVKWKGEVPAAIKDLGEGISQAIKQPQIDSAWARQAIAMLKKELGASWGDMIAGVAYSDENPAKYRVRALELMQLFGPTPKPELLVTLSDSPSEAVRLRTAKLLGMHGDSEAAVTRLQELVRDSDRNVQLAALESLLRANAEPVITDLVPLLSGDDRYISATARRLLENTPTAQWRDELLKSDDQRIQIQAWLALMIAEPTHDNAKMVLSGVLRMLNGFVSDRNFVDLLRVTQVAIARGNVKADELSELRTKLSAEFPIGEPLLNRELIRVLAYLNAEDIIDEAISYLQTDADLSERMNIAMHLRYFKHKWTPAERFSLVKFFEETQLVDSGSSVPLYVMNVTKDLCKDLPLEEARIFVSEGAKWPNAALVSLYRYPEKLSDADLKTLRRLDQEIDVAGYEAEQYKRLKTGIVAMLSQSGDAESMAYLRQVWLRSPERRQAVALGLAQQPNEENWDYLIRSLPVLESFAVPEVMNALRTVPLAADDSDAYREVILHGLRMEQQGDDPSAALELLTYWAGNDAVEEAAGDESKLGVWQRWFATNYPNRPEAILPKAEESSVWNMETLTEYFSSTDGRKGNVTAGQVAYTKAQCANCHRMGQTGKAIGPDLNSITKRFTRKEALESIMFPSHVISDQFATKRVLTTDGKVLSGILSTNTDGSVTIRDSNLRETVVAEQDVDQVHPSKVSLMPSGLLDNLSAEEIRDLMAYLGFVPAQEVAETPQPNKPAKLR